MITFVKGDHTSRWDGRRAVEFVDDRDTQPFCYTVCSHHRMASHNEPAATALLTPAARESLDRSGYGDWRAIASADAVSLAFGFPYPASFPIERLERSIASVLETEGTAALQYGGGENAKRLETIVLEREVARGIDEEAVAVSVTNGATHAIDGICRAFLEPGDTVVVEEPTFMGAIAVFENFGVDVVGAPVDEDGLDVDTLADRLTERRDRGDDDPTLVYTIPNFQNPTGATLSLRRRKRLLELAEMFDFVVLEDDAYGDLRYEGTSITPLAGLDDAGRVIRVGSFSKTIAPGVRLGWLTAAERIRNAVASLTAGGTNTFTRSVVGHYCDVGHLNDSLPELRRTYANRRDRMLDALASSMPAGVTWTEPAGGFFVWVTLPPSVDTDDLLQPAIDAGVTYLPGSMFYSGDGGTNRLRLSYSYESPDDIDEGVRSLAETIASHG